MDYQHYLFAQALNIQEPLYIKKVDFNIDTGELHIFIDFKEGSKFKCAVCNLDGVSVHDTEEKTWRHLDFFQYKAYLHLRTPRTKCPEHNVHLINVPWAGGTGFTLLMEVMILELAKHMAISQIAVKINETDNKVWRVIRRHVNNARVLENYERVYTVGVDETSFKKGHKYISVFVDMDKSKIIFITEGKDANTVNEFSKEFEQLSGKNQNIENFSCDMSPAFKKGIEENFKNASITYDKFHVVKLLNTAVDATRRDEQIENPLLKNSRYVWLKNKNNLNRKQSETLETLSKINLKTARAYRIKIVLQDIYRSGMDKIDAMNALQKWLSWASRSRLPHIISVASTIKKNWNGIINYFDSKITNGLLEGINSLIQSAKSRARGFKNVENFKAIIYLIAGKLTFNFNQ